MTDAEKQDLSAMIASAVARTLAERDACHLGIDAETARELISFAQTWRTCRKCMLIGAVTTAIGGLLAALWQGLKTALHH